MSLFDKIIKLILFENLMIMVLLFYKVSMNQNITILNLNQPSLFKQIENNLYRSRCFVGKYQITDQIGFGAFARVYKTTFQKRDYALKVYDYQSFEQKYTDQQIQFIKIMLENQANLIKKCKSPHIVSCFEVLSTELYMCLCLQYCSHQNLLAYLLRKGEFLQQSEAIGIIKQICLGLIEMHKENIIHRDLKLENIMIVNGMCKIIDLGVSKQLKDQASITFTKIGTDYTQAPQVKKGQAYSLKADIYSLGVIYLYLISSCKLSDRTPYYFYNYRETLFQKRKISKESLHFLQRTLQFNHYLRLSWKQLLNQDIFSLQKLKSPSQIQWQNNFNSIIVSTKQVILQSSFIQEPIRPDNSSKSVIFFANDEQQDIPQKQNQNFKGQIITKQILLQREKQFLKCKKASYIIIQMIDFIQSEKKILMQKNTEVQIILIYLLTNYTINLLETPLIFFKKYPEDYIFQTISQLTEDLKLKNVSYQQMIVRVTKNLKQGFIESEILKNYESIRKIMKGQYPIKQDLQTQNTNLIIFYIQKISSTMFNRMRKSKLLAFKQIMELEIQSIENTTFQHKIEDIRKTYIY